MIAPHTMPFIHQPTSFYNQGKVYRNTKLGRKLTLTRKLTVSTGGRAETGSDKQHAGEIKGVPVRKERLRLRGVGRGTLSCLQGQLVL